MRRPI